MSQYKFIAGITGKDGMYHLKIHVISFEEKGIFYKYSPSLDLYGYGNNEEESKTSFETNLKEFIKYTDNKKTLAVELEKNGWYIRKKGNKIRDMKAPSVKDMLENNEEFNQIVNEKEYTQTIEEIAV